MLLGGVGLVGPSLSWRLSRSIPSPIFVVATSVLALASVLVGGLPLVWQLCGVSEFVWLAALDQVGVLSFSSYILLQPLCSVLGYILWMVFTICISIM